MGKNGLDHPQMGMGIFEDQLIGLVFCHPAPRPTQIIGLLVCPEDLRGDVGIQISVDRKHQVRVAIQELDHQQDSVHRSTDSPHHILGIRGSVEFQVSDPFGYLAVRLMIHLAFIKNGTSPIDTGLVYGWYVTTILSTGLILPLGHEWCRRCGWNPVF